MEIRELKQILDQRVDAGSKAQYEKVMSAIVELREQNVAMVRDATRWSIPQADLTTSCGSH